MGEGGGGHPLGGGGEAAFSSRRRHTRCYRDWSSDVCSSDPKVGGGANKRNAPTMENVAYYHSFYWDGRAPTMEAVSAAAWKGQLGADPDAVAAKLNAIVAYRAQFQRAFKEDATGKNVPM